MFLLEVVFKALVIEELLAVEVADYEEGGLGVIAGELSRPSAH